MHRGPLRIFLSHSSELSSYPAGLSFVAGAEEGVKRAGDAVTDMAYFTARDDRPAAYCRDAVQQANVYVGVIGFRYGSPVPDRPEVSYTELEFDTAGELGLPRLAFLIDEATPLPQSVGTDWEYGDRQKAFRARAKRAGVTVATVRTPQELTTAVLQALTELRERTDARIAGAVERERQPVQRPASRRVKFVNPPPTTAPTWFQGRQTETRLVADFLRADGRRLLALVGRGGAGKTTMVCRLLKALEAGRLPDDLGELAVQGIVYLAPVGTHPVTFPYLFADLCRLLPDEDARRLRALSQDASIPPDQLMVTLLEHFPAGPVVVLLDNLEDVIDPAGQVIKDDDLALGLKALLNAPAHGVKILATTRIPPVDLLQEQPSRAARLDLDAGLPTPFAQDILREMDADGSLGLRDAAAEPLDLARQRTRGFPRALEALVAILNANRDTTLTEVLDLASGVLPERIVSVMVGEAFTRLDRLGQQVMQALAVFTAPVPPVAVDFLLQPFDPAINAAPVLSRLVNMQFARRDVGRYHLHQVDRDYALSQVPAGDLGDHLGDPPAYTRSALRQRAADYFASIRTPRETWKTLDDLTAQLAEFELRCDSFDFDNAAPILFDISFDFLQQWGYAKLALALHQRVQGHLVDPMDQGLNHGYLGGCYADLGQTEVGIAHHQEALRISRETGYREGESIHLGNLGLCYFGLGRIEEAIGYHEQALAISRELGLRRSESCDLGNLGICYSGLGRIEEAIGYHEQALAISREIGHRASESCDLGNLGVCYSGLGRIEEAIGYHEQALAISREIGYRQSEATHLGNLGLAHADLGRFQTAQEYCQRSLDLARDIGDRYLEAEALVGLGDIATWQRRLDVADNYHRATEIAGEIGNAQVQAESGSGLASYLLFAGDDVGCLTAASHAFDVGYSPIEATAALMAGLSVLRAARKDEAVHWFTTALTLADQRHEHTPRDYAAHDIRGLALCGLVAAGTGSALAEALEAFSEARRITSAPGIVARTVRLLDQIIVVDPTVAAAKVTASGG